MTKALYRKIADRACRTFIKLRTALFRIIDYSGLISIRIIDFNVEN